MQFRHDMTVALMKCAASDDDVTFAARVSTLGIESRYFSDDTKNAGLINFLMRDRHGSPFEHTSFTFYVEAPIFVAREFFRHRAGWSYNEESGRYKELAPIFYIPGSNRPLIQVGKPGAYEFKPGSTEQHDHMRHDMRVSYEESFDAYAQMLSDGIAREVARMVLPVGIYTSFYATCNARSLMHFLSLRIKDAKSTFPSFPQREIEMVAEKMESTLAAHMPATFAAFEKNGRVAP